MTRPTLALAAILSACAGTPEAPAMLSPLSATIAPTPVYRSQGQGPLDGSANEQNPASHSFDAFGMPMCVALVLQAEPDNPKARAIWDQLMAAQHESARRWMPPTVGQ